MKLIDYAIKAVYFLLYVLASLFVAYLLVLGVKGLALFAGSL